MRKIILGFITIGVCAVSQIFATYSEVLEENINLHDGGIISFENEKIYLHSQRLFVSQGIHFFINDQNHFIPIRMLLQNAQGYYIDAKEPECGSGHVGFRKVKGVWYCLVDGCPWFYGEHF